MENSPETEALAEEPAQAAHGFVQSQVVQSCETRYRLRRDGGYGHEILGGEKGLSAYTGKSDVK
jgi:hypothetical protein